MKGPTYDSAKLDLADAVRSVMELARHREHAAVAEAAQGLLASLAEDRFQLAVAGRFNGGKSSLMNAVLGRALLPTGMRPLTSVITSVCYGSRDGIEAYFRNGSLPARGTLEQIAEYATEEGNPANGKEVTWVLVRASIELLRRGFYFVDTPGIGSDIAANTATTERYLPEADAVIFVTSFDSPMRPEEIDFLGRVRRLGGKTFYVVNKLDLAPEADRAAALEQIRKRIHGATGEDPQRLFAISARDGLQAKLSGDVRALAASGLPELEAAVTSFIEEGKSREFLTHSAGRAKSLVAAESFYAGLAGQTQDIEAYHRAIQRLFRDVKAAVEGASAKVRMLLPAALESDLRKWAEGTGLALNANGVPRNDERWKEVFSAQWKTWVEERRRSLASCLLDIGENDLRRVLHLADKAREIAAEIRGAESPSVPRRLDLLERVAVLFAAAPESPRLFRRWLQFGETARRRALSRAVEEYAEEARVRTVESALDWIARLFRAAWQDCEAETAIVRAAITSDSAESDLCALRRLDENIDCIVDGVRSLRLDSGPGGRDAGTDGGSLLRCAICARIAGDVYTYLSKDQYELATDPRRQAEHAAEGGFCTLHAWQYESIAAPQGLSLAYAPLLEARAKALAAAAERGGDEIPAALDAASPDAERCRLCRFIAERERALACKVALGLSSPHDRKYVPLCILHLRSVIRAGVAPEVARELIAEEARWLERCARDMRMYALKHYAIRRELATEEERTAYSRGLARVAGERSIAFPWRAEE